MKVSILTTSFPRFEGDFAGNFVLTQAKAITEMKIEVNIVAPHDINTKDFERIEGVNIHRFRYMPLKNMHKFAYGHGVLGNIKKNKSVILQVIPFYFFFVLKSLQVSRKSDIIHAHWLFAGLCAIIIKLIYRKPIICTIHGSDIRLFPKHFVSYILRRFNILIAPTIEVLDYIAGYKTAIEIKNPIDTDMFKRTSKNNELIKEFSLKDEKVVAFIGRLDEFKDPVTFVKAIPYILKKDMNIKFLIVGDGVLFCDIKKLIDDYGINNNVIMTGARGDISSILNISDIFVALSPYENLWSLTILEAMSVGVTLIATKAGKTEMGLINKKNAYLIPPKNEKELANGILTLIKNPDLRRAISNNNSQLLRTNKFTKEDYQNLMLSIYSSVIKG